MYTRLFPTSAGSIVIIPAKGAKAQNLPMPPKTHLALRRYATKSLVQDSLAGRGRRFLHQRAVLILLLQPLARPSRKSSASLRVPRRKKRLPILRLALEAAARQFQVGCSQHPAILAMKNDASSAVLVAASVRTSQLDPLKI